MAVKKKDVTALFASFEQEIARLGAKRHKTEDDLGHLNSGIRALEKQEAQIQSHLKQMLAKGSDMDVKRLAIKDKLNRQSNKLDKLRKLYDELKAV
tara:strand:- start:341 stop:628 length:288 start_codon:yes stop_codon:yes gene_type:complete